MINRDSAAALATAVEKDFAHILVDFSSLVNQGIPVS
jgi:hypothetical protein